MEHNNKTLKQVATENPPSPPYQGGTTENPPDFAHLHVHTHYSLLKSSCTISGLVEKCLQHSQKALAITDYGNMFGVFDLYFKAKEKGIKPILGLEIYLESQADKKHYSSAHAFHAEASTLVLLAKNQEGYQNLCHINTKASQQGFYYVPRVSEKILQQYHSSVIALTGGVNGSIKMAFNKKGPDYALKVIKNLKNIYHDNLYLQLNRTGLPEEEAFNSFLISASQITKLSLVAGNDVHYLNKEDSIVQDVLFCIGSNRTLKDPERFKLKSSQLYFKSSYEMAESFKDVPKALDNVMDIVSTCQLDFKLTKNGRTIYHLPKLNPNSFNSAKSAKQGPSLPKTSGINKENANNTSLEKQPLKKPDPKTPQQWLKELSYQGLKDRLATAKHHFPQTAPTHQENSPPPLKQNTPTLTEATDIDISIYKQRLQKELKIITDMGFADYFLIVYDFVHWAREQGIPVGPGRGSGAGSLVAWCLKITDLDPMPHQLLFERFLNPERISLPDFDIDFCQERRNQVIDYVSQKYGSDFVAQVMTYGRLQARAAIRDVGRVLGMSYAEVDQVARFIPERLGITLESAVKESTLLSDLMESDPQVESLMQIAKRIEGLIRHASIHAAGVIIAERPIISFAPLYRGAEGENVIQCDLNHAKKIGLVKFDFLGLKTLTQIQSAFRMIKKTKGLDLSVKDISLKDPGIYEIMRKGDTKGIFQFEGEGITNLIIKAEPSCFEDIVAINALFRPGPMDMIPNYLDRKKGKVRVSYLFDEMEPILKETYGIIVYQEQVLLIAAKIAGYSYGEADILRRAMGEKKPEVMKKQKTRFLNGAVKNGYNPKKAEKLFDLVEEFAKYGFNKSHAAAYCVVAAQTAWLKRYYPVQFFASLFSVEMNNTDKIVSYMRSAEEQGIKIEPPHINHSEYFFTPRGNRIYFSLGAVKGVGRAVADHITQVRAQLPKQKFVSVQHFFESVDIKKINKKCVDSLAKAGAFDGMEMNRNEIIFNYEALIEQMEQKKAEKESGQINFFGSQNQANLIIYKKQPPWPEPILLKHEKSVIGFYLSGHPMDYLKPFMKVGALVPIASLGPEQVKKEVSVWGILSEFKEVRTKKGNTMAFARIEDGSGGGLEVVFFADVYAGAMEKIRVGTEPLAITGSLEKVGKLLVREVEDIGSRLNSHARGLILRLNEAETEKLTKLQDLLTQHKGGLPLYFNIKLKNPSKTVCLRSGSVNGVSLSTQFLEQVQKTLSSRKVQLY